MSNPYLDVEASCWKDVLRGRHVRPTAVHMLAMINAAGWDLDRADFQSFTEAVANVAWEATWMTIKASIGTAERDLRELVSGGCSRASHEQDGARGTCPGHLVSSLLLSFSSPNADPRTKGLLEKIIGQRVPEDLEEVLESHSYWESTWL